MDVAVAGHVRVEDLVLLGVVHVVLVDPLDLLEAECAHVDVDGVAVALLAPQRAHEPDLVLVLDLDARVGGVDEAVLDPARLAQREVHLGFVFLLLEDLGGRVVDDDRVRHVVAVVAREEEGPLVLLPEVAGLRDVVDESARDRDFE